MNKSCRNLVLIVCGILSAAPVFAQSTRCPVAQADAAEAAVDHLDSWPAVRSAFKAFRGCDEGSIAEGFSAGVVRLLATQFQTLPTLAGLITEEPALKVFVLRHIDTTVNPHDLQKIRQSARKNCPANTAELCKQLSANATQALKKMARPARRS